MTAAPQDAGRADARRNRRKVLAAASQAFDEHGPDVSLGVIAHQAGVGAGTVYRHFPSKEILLEAVLVQQLDDLVEAARQWAARVDPAAAFFGFLLEVVDKSRGRKHACDALTTQTSWPRPSLAASARRFRQALDELLRAAQRAGGVRTDVSTDDVTALTVGCATIWAAHRDPNGGARMVRLALESLRAPSNVTQGRGFRDTPGTLHAMPRCEECGARLEARSTGRPARYCGATCRQRAHRRLS
ncbi:TetR/AcrR family transcriptional regulator [Streptomyces cocklensis]|uniref:Transcriptional regulator, TetR family n=1 Tax=Actinacidiphila cocklensis TaxID=887465 RepID=A0A9W4GN88_9ACTN|nr:TetR/AcrR family transcriptional regulator [Actinacidiphila cocklensis]MDD1063678.1 TetR/AcrR family transcriptional regulator [Actinacidiphila cocklensis]WSX72877.1 TetR/AcrR family transcriptional regulator [Streptomyces sp. NBC_00899]WSX81055.1 TetR/AcrR family transcriptional regulator [Streptomyces sp. NBC_00899]CAG6391110.1 Transcriptional regulator, TetR family [Actinacidiphila cocklensis]